MKLSLIFLISFIYLAILPCFGESNADVLNIERYLNSIHTLKAEIIQISSTGEVETGIIFIKNISDNFILVIIRVNFQGLVSHAYLHGLPVKQSLVLP